MSDPRLIVRLSGGLGNQMFGYAAGYRLARSNGAELVIDPWSGFHRDAVYRRTYALAPFRLTARLARSGEMLRPLERVRRGFFKRREARKPFHRRRYVTQSGERFEPRLLEKTLSGVTYLEGVWPSEDYFADVAAQVRAEFDLNAPTDSDSDHMAGRMQKPNSVAVHVRFFKSDADDTTSNIDPGYYARAFERLRAHGLGHVFLFSDRPSDAVQKLGLKTGCFTVVDHIDGPLGAHRDLWLMAKCHHAIIANSTFSWWGAWLGDHGRVGRMVVAPDPHRYPAMGWSTERFLPARWIKL